MTDSNNNNNNKSNNPFLHFNQRPLIKKKASQFSSNNFQLTSNVWLTQQRDINVHV